MVSLLVAGAVGLGVLLSGFVINEPAPYELYMAGLIAIWGLFGLRISRTLLPLVALLILFNIGGIISLTQMADLREAPLYMAVSIFLAFTAIFFASVTESQPRLFPAIAGAWLVAANVTAFLGICGYFGLLPGAEMFTKYDRAAGAFQDPNVFGPFLAFPAVFLLRRILTGGFKEALVWALPLLVLVTGIFLSFSRGAWGLFGAASILLVAGLFLQSSSGRFRLRVVAMTVCAGVFLAVVILVALQLPGVGELFSTRAQLVQDYDGARLGRFARYGYGFAMALENPWGIGPLVFGTLFGEDTHNIWLKALMDYGWIGFAAYLLLIVWTLAAGFRILFRDRPWQPYLLCAYVVLIGHIALGTVIDTDHWRHFYLLLGLIWGCIALEARHGHTAKNHAAITRW
nr:O-antigen ligase family protein [Tianweitania sediminis]